jgi:hypothetical protein
MSHWPDMDPVAIPEQSLDQKSAMCDWLWLLPKVGWVGGMWDQLPQYPQHNDLLGSCTLLSIGGAYLTWAWSLPHREFTTLKGILPAN